MGILPAVFCYSVLITDTRASFARVVILDATCYTFQTVCLVISYLNNRSDNLQQLSEFPYDDLLLPSEPEVEPEHLDRDPESGLPIGKTHPSGGDDDEDDTVWLDDEQDELLASGACKSICFFTKHRTNLSARSTNTSSRRHEPPIIFSLSLPYIINLVFRLPSPSSPTQVFAGGTPLERSPTGQSSALRGTEPSTSDGSSERSASGSSVGSDEEVSAELDPSDVSDSDRTNSGRRSAAAGGGSMPGDYWVSNGR